MFPEPDLLDQAVPVPLDNVDHRIELEVRKILCRHQIDRPEDRGPPEEKLQPHGNQLPHVAEEDDHRRGEPGKTGKKHEAGSEVVGQLDDVQGDGRPLDDEHGEDHAQEEEMDDQRGKEPHQRQDADTEGHLLDDEGVVQDRPGGAGKGVVKEEPGDDPRCQPEHIRNVLHRLALEDKGEDEPEDGDVDRRVHERPEHAEIGAEILALEVAAGHLHNELAPGDQLGDERGEHTEVVHCTPQPT